MIDVTVSLRRFRGDRYVLRSILLVMLAVAAPLLVLIAYSTTEARDEAEKRAYALLKARADRGAQEIQSVLDQADHLITFMASRARLQALDPDACRSLVLGVAGAGSLYTNVGLLTSSGEAVCVAAARSTKTSFGDAAWFKEGLASGGLHLSGAQRGGLSGKRVIYLTRPVTSPEGAQLGLIALSIDVDALNARLTSLGTGDFSITIRQGNKVLMRAPLGERWVGQTVPDHIINAPDLPSVPVKVAPGLEGKLRAFTVSPIPKYSLESVAGMPEGSVYEEADDVAWRSAATAGSALVLGLVAAWAAALRLASSVKSIGETASRLGAGEANVRADASLPSVFGEVAREFNRLTEVNAARTAELERVATEAVRMRRFYQVLSETGQAIARHAGRSELFEVVCAACTACRLSDSAWVLERAPDGWEVAVHQPPGSAQPSAVELVCLAQRADRVAVPLVEALADGGEAVVVPLHVEAEPSAVLILFSAACGWFDAEVALLLSELGRDLSVGLDLETGRTRQGALVAAEAANQAKSSFLSHVSHELRTRLNAVVGFSHLSFERPAVQGDVTLKGYLRHVLQLRAT